MKSLYFLKAIYTPNFIKMDKQLKEIYNRILKLSQKATAEESKDKSLLWILEKDDSQNAFNNPVMAVFSLE